jgi:thiamine kinase-like enzyme
MLKSIEVGTPRFIAASLNEDESSDWLLLEGIVGKKVKYHKDIEFWYVPSAWLAKFHHQVRSLQDIKVPLQALKYDAHHFVEIANEMYTLVCDRYPKYAAMARSLKAQVLLLAEDLESEDFTWIHGEFAAHNILIRASEGRPSSGEVCPVDWEWFGLGSFFFDLSRISHGYEPENLERFVASYCREAAQLDLETLPEKKFLRELFRYRFYWWCRRAHDLMIWERPESDLEKTLLRSERDVQDLPD